MSTSSSIQKVTSQEEISAIVALAKIIWNEHYTPIIGMKQVDYMLEKFQSGKAIQVQLANGYQYFGVYLGEELSGYLAIENRHPALFISKFYLAADARGKGLARKMLYHCSEIAKEQGCLHLELTVNKYNAKTIAVYEHFGFHKVKEAVFDIGEGYIMDDFVMRRMAV